MRAEAKSLRPDTVLTCRKCQSPLLIIPEGKPCVYIVQCLKCRELHTYYTEEPTEGRLAVIRYV